MPSERELQLMRLRAKPLRYLLPETLFPSDQFANPSGGSFLDSIFYTDYRAFYNENLVGAVVDLVVPAGVGIRVLGIDAIEFGIGNEGYSSFPVMATYTPSPSADQRPGDFSLLVPSVKLRLSFSRELIEPAEEIAPGRFRVAGSDRRAQLWVEGALSIDSDLDLEAQGFDEIHVTPLKIPGLQSLYLTVSGLKLDLSRKSSIPQVAAAGFDSAFRGIYMREIRAYFQDDLEGLPTLRAEQFVIGTGGVSGRISAEWSVVVAQDGKTFDAQQTEMLINLFNDPDFPMALRKVGIEFEKTVPIEFSIEGALKLPFFESIVDAEITLGEGGQVILGLRGLGEGGLLKLTKEQLFELQVNAFQFNRTAEETALTVSGDFELTNDAVREVIPKIGLEGLSVYRPAGADASWKVRLEGGSLEINKSINLFDVARADITEICLGQQGDYYRFCFSGGVQLLEGVDAGGWVENLGFSFRPDPLDVKDLSVDGIGLRVVVPDTFGFQGFAVRKEETGKSYFEGGIDLALIPLEMGLGAVFKVGRNPTCRFAFLAADFCLPGPGIQLGSLPLYLRCMGGLMGINTTPDANTLRDYFPLAARQPQGLKAPAKWRDECGFHAIGVNATIATANPKAFVMEALVAYVHPAMQLLIEGKCWVLGKPEPPAPFHSVMALDLDDLVALINIAAKYEFIEGVLDVEGMCEAYFSSDQSYFALGQMKKYFEDLPADRPVKAKVLQLFDATSYMILKSKPRVWALGASIGLPRKRINLYFASVNFEALIKGEGEMYWGPEQFMGRLDLTGNVSFRIFRKGFDLWLAARVLGMTPDWLVDALLKFGIKFKILWKKFKYEGELPFHWEHRIRPPIPELLREIRLQRALSDKTWAPYLSPSCDHRPSLADIPDVEPDALLALTFHFPMNDRTGYPFGQDVSVLQPHRSGQYTFIAELPGPETSTRGIELFRMKRSEYLSGDDDWEPFTDGRPSTAPSPPSGQPQPVLYGAWQADKAPDGTEGRTHLHLFATPFTFNILNRFPKAKGMQMYDELHLVPSGEITTPALVGSPESQHAIADAAQSRLGGSKRAGMNVPSFQGTLKSLERLRAENRLLPLGALQMVVHREPLYPRTRATPQGERCRNFLKVKPGWYGKDELMHLADEMLLGAFGSFTVPGKTMPVVLSNAEVMVDDSLPYSFRFLQLHDNRGVQADATTPISGTLEKGGGLLKIVLKHRANKVTVHYEGAVTIQLTTGSVQMPSLAFYAAFVKPFSVVDFWKFRNQVNPSPTVDVSEPGRLVISGQRGAPAFNELAFRVLGNTRIYSVCYDIDHTAELAEKEDQLKRFIEITWPNGRGGAPGPATLGELGTLDGIAVQPGGAPLTPGSLLPGYVYKLLVRTHHTMNDGDTDRTRPDSYCALFQVSRPPTNITPYVLATFPKDEGFPHYRAHEFYIRFNRNDVHRLMGEEHGKLRWTLSREAEELSSLQFQDGRDADLSSFLQNTNADRKGWGWGKAKEHVLTREEDVWRKAYNRSAASSVPPAQPISAEMAVPDDMMWIYPVNPVLFRASFDTAASPGRVPGFQSPVAEGLPVGQWTIEASLLQHRVAPDEHLAGAPAPVSFLLAECPIAPPYRLSVWIRPQPQNKGRVGVVLAANPGLSRYLLVMVDPVAHRVQLIRKDTSRDPAVRLWPERTIGLGDGRWSRLVIRVRSNSGGLVVTVELAGEVVLSEETDRLGELPPDELHAGLVATADYKGAFDNVEIVSLERVKELPRPEVIHGLALRYEGDQQPIYKTRFLASRYLDLFDHLNAWDRTVWNSTGTPSNSPGALQDAVSAWETTHAALLTALSEFALDEQQYAAKNRTLEDLEKTRKRIREARYDLDVRFRDVALALGFELAARPERFEFVRASDGRGLLIECPEPIDWTRLLPGRIRTAAGLERATRFLYSSDLTRAIILIEESDGSIGSFLPSTHYVWSIEEFGQLPPQLEWLQGWVAHRHAVHHLILDMPAAEAS